MTLFGAQNGTLALHSYDRAMILATGAVEGARKRFQLHVEGIPDKEVIVLQDRPEQTDRQRRLPQVVVRREDAVLALDRLNQGAIQYRVATPGLSLVTVDGETGPRKVSEKLQAWPFDLTYAIEVYGRAKPIAQRILYKIIASMGVRSSVAVTDSIGCVRSYSLFMQGSIADLTELSEVTHRIPGLSVSYLIHGELDLDRAEMEFDTVTKGAVVRVSKMG